MPTIAVVYDLGAVTAAEILSSLVPDYGVVVLLPPSAHAQASRQFFVEECRAVLDTDARDLAQTLRELGVDGIVTFSERMLATTSAIGSAAGLRVHSGQVLRALTDKSTQRDKLRLAGVDDVRCAQVACVADWPAAAATVGLPAVVKPANGESSRNTVVVDELDLGAAVVERLLGAERRLVVEELLEGTQEDHPFGDYVSVESAVLPSEVVHYAVTGKFRLAPPFREAGQFWPARLQPDLMASVVALADAAISALEIETGLVHTEVKLTPSGPRLIEVNGRMGGLQSELAQRAAGMDLIRLAADIAVGAAASPKSPVLKRVFFQLYNPGPTEAGVLVSTTGGAAVRRLDGVTRHRAVTRPGDSVGGTSTHILDLTLGTVEDHEALAALVMTITRELTYTFQFADGLVTRTAESLRAEA